MFILINLFCCIFVVVVKSLSRNDERFCLTITDSGRLKLKEDHPYYYQVGNKLGRKEKKGKTLYGLFSAL